jgi:DNA replication and repair protein RecF
MATITQLAVQSIRSHDQKMVSFSPGVTVITGANGSGKTSLLEALYIALQGSSFKSSDQEVLKTAASWWKIDIIFDDNDDVSYGKRTVKFDPSRTSGRKQFVLEDRTYYRLPPKHKHPVVLFEPDDLRLLNGSPARRRQFIDRMIGQLNPLYVTNLHKYERALKQRNNLLKRQFSTADDLFAWDVAIAEYGAYIIEQRIVFIEKINARLNEAYNEIAHSDDLVSVHYSHTLIGDGKQKILAELQANLPRDRVLGSTSVGPHRHDVIFKFNQQPALSTASRGENRTIVLALKFLEVEIIEAITGIKPLVLLDDVFSELDESRQNALSDTIREHQIIMTSTHVLSNTKKFGHIEL